MYLNATTDLIRVNVASAADIDVIVSWGAADDGTPPAITDFDSDPINIGANTGSFTILTGVNNDILKPTGISIYNDHASSSTIVFVEYQETDVGSPNLLVTSKLFECLLLAGELMLMNEAGTWFHYDTNGALYPSVGNAANQTEMEAGTATDRYVTPQGVNWHPGVAKFWCKAGVAGTASVSWNTTSIGDTGPGIMTPTIATDFSSSNWAAFITIENLDASIDAAADGHIAMIGLAGQAAGTLQCIAKAEAATAASDPTQWHVVGYGDQ